MDPERWRRIEYLYHLASQLEPDQRVRFLDEETPDDDELKKELKSLLTESFLTGELRSRALSVLASELLISGYPTPLSGGSNLGPYRIECLIGRGGMGDVYRAKDTRLGRLVAVKVLRDRGSIQGTNQKRLEREARAASTLNHPNICAIYDIGTCDEQAFLVMEYLEGE